MDYLKCILFFITFISFIYLIGTSILKNTKNISYRFVLGYIIYSFIVAIIGIPISLLNLSWKIFMILLIVIDLLLLVLSILRIVTCKIKLFPKDALKKNWMLLLIVIAIMFTSLAYIKYYWQGNCLDDGFYINKMATLPYIQDAFRTSPATGLLNRNFSPYLLNTGEMEASVYIYILNISATVYARFFLSAFNYFLLASVILAFANKIYEKKEWKFDEKILQYASIIIILFGFEYTYLRTNNILTVVDSWQFTSAMYYGSSIVKTMGILMLLLPLINFEKIKLKQIIIFIMTSIVLISKSAIAIPLIFLVMVSYLSIYFVFQKSFYSKIIPILFILLLFLVSNVLKDHISFQNELYSLVNTNLKSKFYIFSIICFISGFFLGKETSKINLTIILIACLMLIDPINNIFENLSVYQFVAARTLTLLTYTVIMLGYLYLCIYIFRLIKNKYFITFISLAFTIVLFSFSIDSYTKTYGNIFDSYEIIKNNPSLLPNSTIELGEKLQKLYTEETKKINVLVPEAQEKIDGYQHALAVLLRTNAPNISVITSIGRYGVAKGNAFSMYTKEDTNTYYQFLGNPNYYTYNNFKNLLDTYPINCVVFTDNNKTEYMTELGYKLYDTVFDKKNKISYYIYYNKDVDTDVTVDDDYGNDDYNDIFENRDSLDDFQIDTSVKTDIKKETTTNENQEDTNMDDSSIEDDMSDNVINDTQEEQEDIEIIETPEENKQDEKNVQEEEENDTIDTEVTDGG